MYMCFEDETVKLDRSELGSMLFLMEKLKNQNWVSCGSIEINQRK